MALTKPHNGIPTDIRLRQEELSVPVPAGSQDEAYIQLRKLGFENLVFSYNVAVAWDQPNQTLGIKDISLSGKDMGSLSLSGLMGGFTEEIFLPRHSQDPVCAFRAHRAGGEAQDRGSRVDGQGLMVKGIKLYSEQSEMTEDQARGMVTMMATEALPNTA